MNPRALSHRWLSAAAASSSIVFAALIVARRIRRQVKLREDRRKLQALPDYLLADIGISRGEIERATDFGRGNPLDPSRRL